MKRFERRFKKIDVALAEVLGISAVIGIVCRLLFSGYNHWVYERYVISKEIEKQSMVEQEQRDKYSRSNSGIIKYIKWQFSKKQDKQQQQQLFKQASDHQNRMMEIMNKKLAKMSEEFNNINHKLLMEIEELRKQVQKYSGVEKKEVGMGERQFGKNKHEFNINEEDSSSMMQSVSSTKRNGSLHERLL